MKNGPLSLCKRIHIKPELSFFFFAKENTWGFALLTTALVVVPKRLRTLSRRTYQPSDQGFGWESLLKPFSSCFRLCRRHEPSARQPSPPPTLHFFRTASTQAWRVRTRRARAPTGAPGRLVGHGRATDGPPVGRDAPAVSRVAVTLHLRDGGTGSARCRARGGPARRPRASYLAASGHSDRRAAPGPRGLYATQALLPRTPARRL